MVWLRSFRGRTDCPLKKSVLDRNNVASLAPPCLSYPGRVGPLRKLSRALSWPPKAHDQTLRNVNIYRLGRRQKRKVKIC